MSLQRGGVLPQSSRGGVALPQLLIQGVVLSLGGVAPLSVVDTVLWAESGVGVMGWVESDAGL